MPVMFTEFMGDDVSHHNAELERVVISGCNAQAGSIHELRLYDLHLAKSERWPGKMGLADKWRTCSHGRMKRPQQESRNEKTQKESYGGV